VGCGCAAWPCGPETAGADRRTTVLLTGWAIITAIPALPGPDFEWLRTAGFGTAATIGLWAHGLRRMGTMRETIVRDEFEPLKRAA